VENGFFFNGIHAVGDDFVIIQNHKPAVLIFSDAAQPAMARFQHTEMTARPAPDPAVFQFIVQIRFHFNL
jgi:hypothetical protein